MGVVVGKLKSDIKFHVKLAKKYPKYLEPNLTVVQYFNDLAEEGEGLKEQSSVGEQPSFFIRDDADGFFSTEVEILSETRSVLDVLHHAISSYKTLEVAPAAFHAYRKENKHRIPFISARELPPMAEIEPDDQERYQKSVLRLALRCLRIICKCEPVKHYIIFSGLESRLNEAADANFHDDYVKSDVRIIFQTLYGGHRIERRIRLSTMEQNVDILEEFKENPVVNLAVLKRIHYIITKEEGEEYNYSIINRSKNCNLVYRICKNIEALDVVEHYAIYTVACRIFDILAKNGKLCKLIGQHGGVHSTIKLLKFSRGMYFPTSDSNKESEESEGSEENKSSLGDLVPKDMAQQCMWTLDNLSESNFNVAVMKKEKVKYIIQEIANNPSSREIGTMLIIPKRLQQIKWDQVVLNDTNENEGEE